MNDFKHQTNRLMIFCSTGVFVIALVIFLYRAYLGLTLFSFGDETDKLVGAQMIYSGMHLYKDIFSHHGPLLYLLAQAYVALISSTDFTAVRWIVAAIALLTTASIAASPVFSSTIARLWGSALYLATLSSVWWVQGIHMLLYHAIGGFFLTVTLVQLVIPVFLDKKITKTNVRLAGISIGLSIACAYTFIVPAFLMVLATLLVLIADKKQHNLPAYAKNLTAGFFLVVIVFMLWLSVYGDLKGYWVYHVYFNQAVYIKFLTFSIFDAIHSMVISGEPKKIIGSIATIALIFSAVILIFSINRRPFLKIVAGSILFVSILMLNPRGSAIFQNGGYVVASLALFSVLTAHVIDARYRITQSRPIFYILVGLLCVVMVLVEIASRRALSTPLEIPRKDFHNNFVALKPSSSERYILARKLVDADEKLQALVLNPEEYIYSNRLPATGNFFYLPWQALYNKNPVEGYKLDLCRQLIGAKPPLIIFDHLKIWGVLAVDDYEPCLLDLLKRDYIQLPSEPGFYVRPDRMNRLSIQNPDIVK